jgi:hypothetical protein
MEFPFSFFRIAVGIAFFFLTASTNNKTPRLEIALSATYGVRRSC